MSYLRAAGVGVSLTTIIGVAIACGDPVYTTPRPVEFRDCAASDGGCHCDDGVTATPGVEVCSAASIGGGVCCEGDGGACDCAPVGCTDEGADGGVCHCGPGIQGGSECFVRDRTCCMRKDHHDCTCRDEAHCEAEELPVLSCGASRFSCGFLDISGSDVPSCSLGAEAAP